MSAVSRQQFKCAQLKKEWTDDDPKVVNCLAEVKILKQAIKDQVTIAKQVHVMMKKALAKAHARAIESRSAAARLAKHRVSQAKVQKLNQKVRALSKKMAALKKKASVLVQVAIKSKAKATQAFKVFTANHPALAKVHATARRDAHQARQALRRMRRQQRVLKSYRKRLNNAQAEHKLAHGMVTGASRRMALIGCSHRAADRLAKAQANVDAAEGDYARATKHATEMRSIAWLAPNDQAAQTASADAQILADFWNKHYDALIKTMRAAKKDVEQNTCKKQLTAKSKKSQKSSKGQMIQGEARVVVAAAPRHKTGYDHYEVAQEELYIYSSKVLTNLAREMNYHGHLHLHRDVSDVSKGPIALKDKHAIIVRPLKRQSQVVKKAM